MESTRSLERENKLDNLLPHLTRTERIGLEALVERLHQRYSDDLLRVVLFGSKARGDSDDESDLDLLIVVRMQNAPYRRHWDEILDIAWHVELTYGIVTSLIIKDEDDYLKMCKHLLLLARNINRDGIEIWTA